MVWGSPPPAGRGTLTVGTDDPRMPRRGLKAHKSMATEQKPDGAPGWSRTDQGSSASGSASWQAASLPVLS